MANLGSASHRNSRASCSAERASLARPAFPEDSSGSTRVKYDADFLGADLRVALTGSNDSVWIGLSV